MCQMEAKARLPKNDRCELLLVRQGTTTRPEKYERRSVGSGAANVLQGECEWHGVGPGGVSIPQNEREHIG